MSSNNGELSTELVISQILRWGVRVSLALILFGSLLAFVNGDYGAGWGEADLLPALRGENGGFPRSLGWLFSGLASFKGAAWIVAGLALLISTPVMRVTASVVAFAIHKDRTFLLISLSVLTLVLLSFALGGA